MKKITESQIRQVVREELNEIFGFGKKNPTKGQPLNLSTRSDTPSEEEKNTFINNIMIRLKDNPTLAHNLVQAVEVSKSKPMSGGPRIGTLNFATVLKNAANFFTDEQQKDQVLKYINRYGKTLENVVQEIVDLIKQDEDFTKQVRRIRESIKRKR